MNKIPGFVRKYYSELTWKFDIQDKELYLTFDDGPTPNITNWTLDILDTYDAKATFFCIGKNVSENPEIYSNILKRGHAVGNHTYDHLKGWTTDSASYFENTKRCAELVKSNLFRPPYGRIKKKQINLLRSDYRIIMWDVLSRDYDTRISPEKCAQIVKKQAQKGSIIVFHDSVKAEVNLKMALPEVLEYFKSEGYSFKSIE